MSTNDYYPSTSIDYIYRRQEKTEWEKLEEKIILKQNKSHQKAKNTFKRLKFKRNKKR